MFTCPKCHTRLARAQDTGVVLWVCATCHGRLMTVPLLRRLVERGAVNRLWQAARGGSLPGERNCPACHRAMVQVAAEPADHRPPLDVCPRCSLVWFDTAEFESMPPIAAPDDDAKPLSQRSREAAAMLRLEQLKMQQDSADDGPAPAHLWQVVLALFGVPVEDEGMELSRRPWATWIAAAVIVLASLLGFAGGEETIQRLGLTPARWWRDGGLTFVTSFLLHAGWLHLVGNLYFLLVFGDNVEDFLGWRRWLVVLVLSALVGDLLHIAGSPGSTVPAVGASGGISGLLAFYALKFPRAKLFMMMGYWFRYAWARVPAVAFFGLWVFLQAAGAWRGAGSTAWLAHLGGAGGGVVCWLLWRNEAWMDRRPAAA